ncbi:NAD(P)H-dependent flavin oxidoreductase [Thermaurantimonas aggregans]|uniref:NAD(P)H-dependent flavin oxidoreductase n=1 Tax=Thermaurantimonas aggregans TaxID=2173829 RepID=UPI0023EFE857|nr:nitronate monooxygenase [Thermaurantimonas aggregans]MCX8148780.1 nitronate monooxygenase [Thermaurantimonas aggregans]
MIDKRFDFSKNRVCSLFGIRYPVIQAGMIWVSGWKLARAVSDAGGLGIIGAGSMYPDVLREHIQKFKAHSDKPFAVNVPMLYPDLDKIVDIIIEERVPIVFTSAGNPATYTPKFKDNGLKVVHVVSSVKFALKAQAAGVDAVVAEGFEAGGHNGREETTTMVLIPAVRREIDIPLIAAGGIGSGASMMAAMALGAEGVQVGSRFAASVESSAHQAFKKAIVNAKEGDTILTLKELAPVRLIKNRFYDQVMAAYERGATVEELKQILGRARAKKGMFEGDLDEGELEIGQISAIIDDIKPAAQILQEIISEYNELKAAIRNS